MKNEKSHLTELLSMAAIAGNILFVLWILYNGINESFQGTAIEKISYISLMGLLTVNTYLLIRNRRQQNKND
jgi:hypothetical protein